MRCSYAPHSPPPCPDHPPPPARPVPPATTCPRHATQTHQTYQWEIGCLVDGVGEYASHAHAPRFPYRLGINGTVWGFGLIAMCKRYRIIRGYMFQAESRVWNSFMDQFYLHHFSSGTVISPPQKRTYNNMSTYTVHIRLIHIRLVIVNYLRGCISH